MLQRTIVSIEQDARGDLVARLTKAEFNPPNARDPISIGYNPAAFPALDGEPNLKQYGLLLRDSLNKHPAIQSVLESIFRLPAGQSRTLCFEIISGRCEQIRWEALCDDQGEFVALDVRCLLGRIADEVSTQETGVRAFKLPLRVAAFLSAAGRDAAPELSGFVDAYDAARAAGLSMEARVYLGQRQLLDQLKGEVAGGGHPGLSAFPMPGSDLEVERALNDWQPHVVHFFCHGSTGYGKAYLELATILNHEKRETEGSVIMEVNSLVVAEGIRNAWLVVLNCCEGATAEERLASMAFRIVANGSVPAVIGMQEPIPVGDANVFCQTLYPELFRLLAEVVKSAVAKSKPVALDLTGALVNARRAIHTRHMRSPASFRNWTLPVLYVQRETLQVQCRIAESDDQLAQIRDRVSIVAGMLRQLSPTADPLLRQGLLALLDKPPVVPPEMRPDPMGQFPADS